VQQEDQERREQLSCDSHRCFKQLLASFNVLVVGTMRPDKVKVAAKGPTEINLNSKESEHHRMFVKCVGQAWVTFLVRKCGQVALGLDLSFSGP
jgi:hypothetical protein